jgi:hypothetical protein
MERDLAFHPKRGVASAAMAIERFIWTIHAERRRVERLLNRSELEWAVRRGHTEREINPGEAAWLIRGLLIDGRHFEIVYDHPHRSDHATVRIVSVWDF